VGDYTLAVVLDNYRPLLDPSISSCRCEFVREHFIERDVNVSLKRLARERSSASKLELAMWIYKPGIEKGIANLRESLVSGLGKKFYRSARRAAIDGVGPALLSYEPPNEGSASAHSMDRQRDAFVNHVNHEIAMFRGRRSDSGLMRATWKFDPNLAGGQGIPRQRFVKYVIGSSRDFVENRLSWTPSGFRAFAGQRAARQRSMQRETGQATAGPLASSPLQEISPVVQKLRQAVPRLEHDPRLAIELVYCTGFSEWEAAIIAEARYGAFRQRLNRAREALRIHVRPLDPIDCTLRNALQGATIEGLAREKHVTSKEMQDIVNQTQVQLQGAIRTAGRFAGKDRRWLAPILESPSAMNVLLNRTASNPVPQEETKTDLQHTYEAVSRIRVREHLEILPEVSGNDVVANGSTLTADDLVFAYYVLGKPKNWLTERYPHFADTISERVDQQSLQRQRRLVVCAFLLTRDALDVAKRFQQDTVWVECACKEARYLLGRSNSAEAKAVDGELSCGEIWNQMNLTKGNLRQKYFEKLCSVVIQCMQLSALLDVRMLSPTPNKGPIGGSQ
jgi:hypothetical protein